ncbi:MAG: hypothetical protein ABSC37_08220 [Xanthobacteraceae bacterium]|jgi:hypothetical protein
MRSAGNFHPEWGYLAPAPSFMRTIRFAVVATAVGATAGVGVMVSLVERPAADVGDTSIAAHALVTSVPAATLEAASVSPVNKPAVAQAQAQVPVQAQAQPQPQAQPSVENQMSPPPTGGPARSAGASEASTTSTPQAPASIAALTELPPGTEASPTQARDEATVAPDAAPAQKKASKKHRSTGYNAFRRWQENDGYVRKKWSRNDRGFGPLLWRLFSARTRSSYYPN